MFPRLSQYLRQHEMYGCKPLQFSSISNHTQQTEKSFLALLKTFNYKLTESWVQDFIDLVSNLLDTKDRKDIYDACYYMICILFQICFEQAENDPLDYQLTLADVTTMKSYIPKIKHHYACKMFSVITEIGEARREEIWKEYITKKAEVKKLALTKEPEDWKPIEIPNAFANSGENFENCEIDENGEIVDAASGNAFSNMFLSGSKNNTVTELNLPSSKSDKNKGSLPKMTWLEKKLYNLNKDVELSTDLASSIFRVLNTNQTDDDPQLQSDLFQLLGDSGFDLMFEIMGKRAQIVKTYQHQALKTVRNNSHMQREASPAPMALGIHVQTQSQKNLAKKMRKEDKKNYERAKKREKEGQIFTAEDGTRLDIKNADDRFLISLGLNPESLNNDRNVAMIDQDQSDWYRAIPQHAIESTINLPNVYDSLKSSAAGAAIVGQEKVITPNGTERTNCQTHEEFSIPPMNNQDNLPGEERVRIDSLDKIGQRVFKGYDCLNRIQTIIFDAAYNNSHNLLICAPTGAGKTNVALMAVIRCIRSMLSPSNVLASAKTFKMVYSVFENVAFFNPHFKRTHVAPMKALAAEMTATFSKRLGPLGVVVRELTGDTKLSKQEIEQTHMLVVTPEKWDVVTRTQSAGETSLAKIVKLIILDEVHLLHDERGPVIESIVARTLRQVEMTQKMVRIVGLSATLPNYVDVAKFLRVDLKTGLFFFDGRFRPIPLGTTFTGVKAKTRLMQMTQMDDICYDKVFDAVERGHQCMIFVHARNATVFTAQKMIEMAKGRGDSDLFLPQNTTLPVYQNCKKKVNSSKNQQWKELFQGGFGMHHAGMLRGDRTMVERAFSDGHMRILGK